MEALERVLGRLMKRLGIEDELQGWRAVEIWERVAGPQVARRTRAVDFERGVLLVEVEGSAWIQQLHFLKRQLIEAINRELGATRVSDIRFDIPRKGVLR